MFFVIYRFLLICSIVFVSSERFLVKLSKEGFSNYVEKIHSNCTIFTVSERICFCLIIILAITDMNYAQLIPLVTIQSLPHLRFSNKKLSDMNNRVQCFSSHSPSFCKGEWQDHMLYPHSSPPAIGGVAQSNASLLTPILS